MAAGDVIDFRSWVQAAQRQDFAARRLPEPTARLPPVSTAFRTKAYSAYKAYKRLKALTPYVALCALRT